MFSYSLGFFATTLAIYALQRTKPPTRYTEIEMQAVTRPAFTAKFSRQLFAQP